MTQFLFALYGLVMISGLWGVILQNLVPKLMRNYLSEEVIFEEIPFIRKQLILQAEAIREQLVTESEEAALRIAQTESGTATATLGQVQVIATAIRFLDQAALPYLKGENSRRFRLRDKTEADELFRLLTLQVPEAMHPTLGSVQNLCDEKRRIDFQSRLHYWLHAWLLVHAPASLLLVVFTILHAIVATYLYA